MNKETSEKSADERISEIENIIGKLQVQINKGGGVAARQSGSSCWEDVKTPISGTHVYKTIEDGEDCPPPSPVDKAKAVLAARNELQEFGKTWCEGGNNNCNSAQCKPILSDISVENYEIGSRPQDGDTKHIECFITANITGTVSCKCE